MKFDFNKSSGYKKYPKRKLSPLAKSLNAHDYLRSKAINRGDKISSDYHDTIKRKQISMGKIMPYKDRKKVYEDLEKYHNQGPY